MRGVDPGSVGFDIGSRTATISIRVSSLITKLEVGFGRGERVCSCV